MRLLLAALLSVVPALPQAPAKDPKCAGAPDGIFGKKSGVYYGCLQGKEVRSNDPGAIPPEWIANFDAKIREVDAAFKVVPRKPARSTAPATIVSPVPVAKAATAIASPIVDDERAKSTALGSGLTEVVEQLGPPYMRISGDTERLTYRLTSGNLARLEFDNGRLARIRIVERQ